MAEQTDGYYTYTTVGPGHKDYGNSGFTEAQVLELGKKIAHFYGPFAKIEARKLYLRKTQEISHNPNG